MLRPCLTCCFIPLSQWIKLLRAAATMSMELIRQYKLASQHATWTPTQKEEAGKSWFAFSKWDRGFVYWVTGKSLDLRKEKEGGTVNAKFCQDLLEVRQKACDAALAQAISDEDEPSAKGRKLRARTKERGPLAPHSIRIETPAYGEVEALQAMALFEGVGTQQMWPR